MKFSDWFTEKYLEYRGRAVGHDRSISDFAKMLDVSQSLVSELMSGKKPPGLKTVEKISKYYDDVHEALNLSIPNNRQVYYFAPVDPNRPSPQTDDEFHSLVDDILEQTSHISNSAEKRERINQILKEKKVNIECYSIRTESLKELQNQDQLFFALLPDDWRNRLLEAQGEYTALLASKGITANSPEGKTIINTILSKHGINLTSAAKN